MRPETQAWLSMSDDDWEVAALLHREERFSAQVFYIHLSIEKLLKAMIMESSGAEAVYSHNLPYLAGLTAQKLPDWLTDFLARLSAHGVAARYDPYSGAYTVAFCDELLELAGRARQWLRQTLT